MERHSLEFNPTILKQIPNAISYSNFLSNTVRYKKELYLCDSLSCS